jgi:Cytochrome c554 and c-prime
MFRSTYVLTLGVVILIGCALGCRRPSNVEPPPQFEGVLRGAAPPFLMGVASCAGRSCHGSLQPLDQSGSWQMEYTLWTSRDPHARAYQILHEPAAKAIAALMGLRGGNAHEAPSCLACHATPVSVAPMTPAPDAESLRREQSFGVGCEACHGSATRWIDVHFTREWRGKDPKSKWEDDDMVELGDAATLVRTCARCHVGDGHDGRDVNHDLIAAGHPRLMFEASSFLANLPRHWKAKPRDEIQLWAVGQAVSAEVALEQLSRGDDWPEFAQYDCTGCHHDLTEKSWRNRGGRWAWGTWYLSMPGLLAEDGKTDGLPNVNALAKLLENSSPSKSAIRQRIEPALADLKSLQSRLAKWKDDRDFAQEKMRWLPAHQRLGVEPSWDAAEQTYLAMQVLNSTARDGAIQKRLGELLNERTWPPPARFDPQDFFLKLRPSIESRDR